MPISERSTEQIILEATAWYFFMLPSLYPDVDPNSIGAVTQASQYLSADKTWSPEQQEIFLSQVGLKARGRLSCMLLYSWERRLAKAKNAYYQRLREMRLDPKEFQAQLDDCGACCNLRCVPNKNPAHEINTARRLADIYNDRK